MANLTFKIRIAAALLAGASVIVAIAGCHNEPGASTSSAGATTQPLHANIFAPPPPKGGAQLWAENCTRCHNAPPPDRYSDAQWDVAVQHMRLCANLTGEESRKIVEFLKASN